MVKLILLIYPIISGMSFTLICATIAYFDLKFGELPDF